MLIVQSPFQASRFSDAVNVRLLEGGDIEDEPRIIMPTPSSNVQPTIDAQEGAGAAMNPDP